MTPPPRHVHRKISTGVDGGLSGGSSVHRPGSEDPHRRQRKFSLFLCMVKPWSMIFLYGFRQICGPCFGNSMNGFGLPIIYHYLVVPKIIHRTTNVSSFVKCSVTLINIEALPVNIFYHFLAVQQSAGLNSFVKRSMKLPWFSVSNHA